jgi:hypothetical protein
MWIIICCSRSYVLSKVRNLTARTSVFSLRTSYHFRHCWLMNPCLLSLVTLGSIGLHILSSLVVVLLNVKCSITHWSSCVTWLLSLYFNTLFYLLLLINLLSILFIHLLGAKSLWARAIHNNVILNGFNFNIRNLGSLITAHDAASENAICSWNSDLSLISLMISHAALRTNVHIRTTSLSFSHTLEHYLSLFISSTFIV